eukprot:2914678-Rhodomonas_salina.1
MRLPVFDFGGVLSLRMVALSGVDDIIAVELPVAYPPTRLLRDVRQYECPMARRVAPYLGPTLFVRHVRWMSATTRGEAKSILFDVYSGRRYYRQSQWPPTAYGHPSQYPLLTYAIPLLQLGTALVPRGGFRASKVKWRGGVGRGFWKKEGWVTVMFLNKPPSVGSILYHTGGGLISEHLGIKGVFTDSDAGTQICA